MEDELKVSMFLSSMDSSTQKRYSMYLEILSNLLTCVITCGNLNEI